MQLQATSRNAKTCRDVLSKHFAQAKDPGKKSTAQAMNSYEYEFLGVEIRLKKMIMIVRVMRL